MKAMQVSNAKRGPVLIPVDVPKSELGTDEVLVHVHAAGVTPTELLWFPTTHTKEGAAHTGAVPGHERVPECLPDKGGLSVVSLAVNRNFI
jgi:NADPH:quinone reductase-like Zn-dependent oxidoreductase